MELLRVQPYDTVNAEYVVPDTFTESTEFFARITDMADLSVIETTYTGQAGEIMTFSFSGLYDNSYRVELGLGVEGMVVPLLDETYSVVRPYVDPATLGTTASEIATATANEELARAIIDSVIPQGFYYKKQTFETTGLGADYLPLWVDAKKILKVYENNVLLYDASSETNERTYEITKDKTAIVESYSEIINRTESAPNILPAGASDLLDLNYAYRGFPKTFDYRLVLEVGYTSVPSDIKKAAELLIDDIACGKMDYYKRYVSAYNTDQYKVQFDKKVFEGTGNILVDKILSKYAKSITRLGVL